jgi:hypothetical protein
MRVASFVHYCAGNGRSIYQDFINTIPNVQLVDRVEDCDVLVIWSVLWRGAMANFKPLYNKAKELGKPIIIFEVGMLQRNITWKISVDATTLEGLYWPKELWQSDRVHRMLSHINTVTPGDTICICGQNAHSANWLKDKTVDTWVEEAVDTVKQYTDRPIEIRPHPRYELNIPKYKSLIVKSKYTQMDDTDFVAKLKNYWAVINVNSYPGQQARLYGINAVVDKSSLASPVSHTDISMIENRLEYPHMDWLNFVAHTEFTTHEIKSGLAWEVIQPLLNR